MSLEGGPVENPLPIQHVTYVECVNDRCGYDYEVSPPPQVKPHCPKCGGPTRLETRVASPPPVVVDRSKVPQASPGFPPVSVLHDFSDAELIAELRRRDVLSADLLPQISDVAADDNALGTDSVPVDDGTPPI